MAGQVAVGGATRKASLHPIVVPAITLIACVVLGGGTRPGFLSDALLQLLSVPLLLAAIYRWVPYQSGDSGRASLRIALALIFFLILTGLAQLVPLPPGVWTTLPGREVVAQSFEVAGQPLPWLPLSVLPEATWLALLSLVPSIAVFLGVVQLDYENRRRVALLIIALATISMLLGGLQFAQGPASPLRPFEITNPQDPVGFFANRNHFAALMYSALVLVAVFASLAVANLRTVWKDKHDITRPLIVVMACFTIIVLLIAAQAMARSRAGTGLMLLAMLGAALATSSVRTGSEAQEARSGGWMMLIALGFTLVLAGQYALYQLLERFYALDATAGSRVPIGRNTIEAALAYMPFGSGIGSFVPVYGLYEKQDEVFSGYINRAHDDFLEAWLEMGAAAFFLIGGFLVWLLSRAAVVWSGKMPGAGRTDLLLARAATLVVALLIAHSVVDYPLRTGAVGALFAFCCAMMLPPPRSVLRRAEAVASAQPRQQVSGRKGRSRSSSRSSKSDRSAGSEAQDAAPLPPLPSLKTPIAVPPLRPSSASQPPPLPGAAAPSGAAAGPPGTDPSWPAGRPDSSKTEWPEGIADRSRQDQRDHRSAQPSNRKPEAGPTWTDKANWPEEWRATDGMQKPSGGKEPGGSDQ